MTEKDSTTAGYILVDIRITDPVRYEEYKRLAHASLAPYGGTYLVRGGAHEVLEGDRVPNRIVVLRFDSVERARAWWSSKEYAGAAEIRRVSAETSMILVEGMS